ncbi:MAG: hypothetical protein AAB665_01195 [Patescibacteria group bacterium]
MKKILSIYEVLFGVVGVGMTLFILGPILLAGIAGSEFSIVALCIFLLAIVFYVVSVIAGVLLYLNKALGKTLSIVMHILQVPVFTVGGITYFISLGLNIPVIAGATANGFSFGLRFFFGPQFSLSFGENGFLAGLNIAAVILVVLFSSTRD